MDLAWRLDGCFRAFLYHCHWLSSETLCASSWSWLTLHISLNMFAILCMVVSFGIAVYTTNEETAAGEDPKHFTDLRQHNQFGDFSYLLYASNN
jgi:hypothetical protein